MGEWSDEDIEEFTAAVVEMVKLWAHRRFTELEQRAEAAEAKVKALVEAVEAVTEMCTDEDRIYEYFHEVRDQCYAALALVRGQKESQTCDDS